MGCLGEVVSVGTSSIANDVVKPPEAEVRAIALPHTDEGELQRALKQTYPFVKEASVSISCEGALRIVNITLKHRIGPIGFFSYDLFFR